MQPIELTFQHLHQTIVLAHQQYVQNNWNVSQATAFLKMHCLSKEFIDRCIDHGNSCMIKLANDINLDEITTPLNLETDQQLNIVDDVSDEEEARRKIERAMAANPALFDRVPTPPLWKGNVSLDCYVEAPMHLLFLGIVESVIKMRHEWLLRRRQTASFVSYAEKVMSEMIAMNLPWCKLIAYGTTGKFGGWVSENYLAFSRLLKWFYLNAIMQLPENNREYQIPSRPVQTWSNSQCREFMSEYSVTCDGTPEAIKQAIQTRRDELVRGNIPPRRASKDDVIDKTARLADMLQLAMKADIIKEEIRQLDLSIRLFLHAVHKFDNNFNKYPAGHEKYTPVWVTKYNFLSLLKLPDTIRQFGPVRGYWEGGAIGEGFLRSIKPEIKRGLRYDWRQWIMNNFLGKKAFDMIPKTFDETPKSYFDIHDRQSSIDDWKTHSSAAFAIRKFYAGLPCSLICTGGMIGLVYKSVHSDRVIQVIPKQFKRIQNGLAYFAFELQERGEHSRLVSFTGPRCGALLLPAVQLEGFESINNGHPNSTVILSNWVTYTTNQSAVCVPLFHTKS